MRKSILVKIALIIFLSSLIPAWFFNLLIVFSYQDLINEYQTIIQEYKIEISSQLQKNLKELKQIIFSQILLTLLLIFILVGFAFGMLFKEVILPLRHLEKAFKEVAKGNLKIELKTQRTDEIGSLIQGFNQMVKELKQTQDLLEEERASLEIKVKARTRALEEERQLLEEKVKERTKELKERIEELEKFHRLAVGRELKMIELKQKLKALEERLKSLQSVKKS